MTFFLSSYWSSLVKRWVCLETALTIFSIYVNGLCFFLTNCIYFVGTCGIVLSYSLLKLHQVNGCLSYFDKVPDGFYLIHGMDPYVWSMCTDLQENGRIPSLELLKSVDSSFGSSIEAVLVDRRSDPSLKELQNRVLSISCSCITTKEVVDQLAKLVCNRMG